MGNAFFRLGGAALIGSFIYSIVWTEPGPNQQRNRRILILLAVLVGLAVLAIAIAAGIAEGKLATPESDKNQFDVGYLFATLALSLPVVVYGFAIAGVAWRAEGSNGSRAASAIALGIFAGIPAWLAIIFLMVRLESAFHP